nr:5'-3'-deoxyribonucleotidase [Bdellovibrio sp. HM001]
MKKKVFIDMDDTIADFIGSEELQQVGIESTGWPRQPVEMYNKGFFRNLQPIEGAVSAIRSFLNNEHLDVYILTKPVYDSPHSYSEKVEWIREYFPALLSKMVMAQDKGLIRGDYLIDDSLHWKEPWEATNPEGMFIHFDPRKSRAEQWRSIVALIDFMTFKKAALKRSIE